ncbi:M23 family metallopeptidase [Rhodobium orientis]|uniref:M23ase beta-sheet core domain-containing protein n=1 Tax=Rhodobium orientis TaxID=34017 RepID=A0A327JK82_9HYPH|nr:M23 family metallopeptidase [Rhodobium orientis]MBK5948682.1 hypothetical protein [Rhodobium orientis]RAI26697.1 hypothetical protein CH339_13225 [Rhodobium orientis]
MHLGWNDQTYESSVDLGDEPPILVGDDRNMPPDHRRVSLRWLTGTVLTGMTSMFLMGGALFVALDGRHTFATPPQAMAATEALRTSVDPVSGAIEKGDRIRLVPEGISNRQIMTVSTVTRVGDRDIIKDRPFVRITASLAQRKTDLISDIPPFNPLRIFSDSGEIPATAETESIYGAEVDGEVAITVRDFPTDNPLIDADASPSEAEIEAMVRRHAVSPTGENLQVASLPRINPDRFDFELAKRPSALGRFAIRIVPENVSFVAKTEEPTADITPGLQEKVIDVDDNTSLKDLLIGNGSTDDEAEEITAVLGRVFRIGKPPENGRVRLGIDEAEIDIDRSIPVRISIYDGEKHIATVARSDDGFYVPANEPPPIVTAAAEEEEPQQPVVYKGGPALNLYESIYQTGMEQQIPVALINDLIRIFSFEVDFNTRVSPSDKVEVFYALADERDPGSAKEILFASLTLKSNERRFYRFKTPDDGAVDYYDETGKSSKKFLMRKPMSRGKFRSGFGSRRHPILGYARMHKGVDWAAPRGTPVMASGNGVIEEAKWKSGYGRWVKIRHSNGYATGYGHMSGFAKGIQSGQRIRQGQVIGFVGSTGLSTGPHLHYEVMVNGRHVNPLRIRLPRGRVLTDDVLTSFEQERNHIDALLAKEPGQQRLIATN